MNKYDREVSLDAIEAIEAAGLGGIIDSLGLLLRGADGDAKHPGNKWIDLPPADHWAKAIRHRSSFLHSGGVDEDSGFPGAVHVVARVAMWAAKRL